MHKISVLFVCLGNICRSPTAHAVFQSMVSKQNLTSQIYIDSAGTGDWHLGHAPDLRSTEAAALKGYDMSSLRSRLVTSKDFAVFDYVIAMDKSNLSNLRVMCPTDFQGDLRLFLDYARQSDHLDRCEVPDPYYGQEDGFPFVLDLIEDASIGLLDHIKSRMDL
mgnify:CR=1 FL=1